MYLVGHPRPTNPGKQLAGVAGRRGWPILRFDSRNSSESNARLRNIAGIAALAPVGSLGVAVGLATRNKRSGLNFATPLWLDVLFAINGVRIDVDRPREPVGGNARRCSSSTTATTSMRSCRPGSSRRTSPASPRRSSRRTPSWEPSASSPTSRSSTGRTPPAAIEALKPIQELARKGISILIAPEGTRIDTTEVGPFKKGAFHMAMAAGIPIVPIVIRDAEMVASSRRHDAEPRHRPHHRAASGAGRRLDDAHPTRPRRRRAPDVHRHAPGRLHTVSH